MGAPTTAIPFVILNMAFAARAALSCRNAGYASRLGGRAGLIWSKAAHEDQALPDRGGHRKAAGIAGQVEEPRKCAKPLISLIVL